MARKKGVPQRSGLTRADYERVQREEAESERREEEERKQRQTALAAAMQLRGLRGETIQHSELAFSRAQFGERRSSWSIFPSFDEQLSKVRSLVNLVLRTPLTLD